MEMKEALLDIMEQPTKFRVIVQTQIPTFGTQCDNLYYMIDKGDCGCEINGDAPEVFDHYQVTTSTGDETSCESWREVVEFFDKLAAATTINIYVESF
jgi:hypothetical protein